MRRSAIARLSTDGKVSIPKMIRKFAALKPGTQMVVFTDGVNILLKPIAPGKKGPRGLAVPQGGTARV